MVLRVEQRMRLKLGLEAEKACPGLGLRQGPFRLHVVFDGFLGGDDGRDRESHHARDDQGEAGLQEVDARGQPDEGHGKAQQREVQQKQPRDREEPHPGSGPMAGDALKGRVEQVEAAPHDHAEDDAHIDRMGRIPGVNAHDRAQGQADDRAQEDGLDQPAAGRSQEIAFAYHAQRIGPPGSGGPGFCTNGGFRRTNGDGIMAHEP